MHPCSDPRHVLQEAKYKYSTGTPIEWFGVFLHPLHKLVASCLLVAAVVPILEADCSQQSLCHLASHIPLQPIYTFLQSDCLLHLRLLLLFPVQRVQDVRFLPGMQNPNPFLLSVTVCGEEL